MFGVVALYSRGFRFSSNDWLLCLDEIKLISQYNDSPLRMEAVPSHKMLYILHIPQAMDSLQHGTQITVKR
jgi:hypothetical protein